ncbi:MAG: extracellular solute-binding protein [Christensenellales bacterium]|jgi:putative aldouronate transport system substrate-binding protein
MKLKKVLVIMMALLLCIVPLTACTQGEGTGGASQAGTGEPPREVSLCMSQIRWGISVDDTMMKLWTQAMEEATNTKIEIIAPTHNDYMDKVNVLLSSGDYPDIIRPQQAWDYVSQFAVRGYLQPLTEHINNDSRFAQLKDVDLSIYQSGSDYYGIPAGKGNCKIIWFRQDMTEKYGLNIKDVMTTDEFITELSKVDQSEVIPFSFPKHIVNFQLFYNFFGAYGGILPDDNGVYYDGIQTDEMKEALLWVKQLYDQGLMDSEFITNENANMREKLSAARAVSDIDYSARYTYYVQTAADVGVPTDFIPVYTLVGPDGGRGNLNESGGEAMCLSVTNKSVEASLDIIDWLFFTKEGKLVDTVGLEGVHYDIADGVLVGKESAVAAGYNPTPNALSDGWAVLSTGELGFGFDGISEEVLASQLEYTGIALDGQNLGPLIKIPMGISSLYDENVASYNSNLYEMATKIVLGTQDIDTAYAEYARFWSSIKGDEMLNQLNGK